MREPLPVPTALDLGLFWPPDGPGRLYGPLDLANPFHRDALWSEIERSIETSDTWMDVLDQRSERREYHPAHYLALKTEADAAAQVQASLSACARRDGGRR